MTLLPPPQPRRPKFQFEFYAYAIVDPSATEPPDPFEFKLWKTRPNAQHAREWHPDADRMRVRRVRVVVYKS